MNKKKSKGAKTASAIIIAFHSRRIFWHQIIDMPVKEKRLNTKITGVVSPAKGQ
jgi:hypothetical protein